MNAVKLTAIAVILTVAGCGLFAKPQPTITEMEAAIKPVVTAAIQPIITAQGDVSQQLTTLLQTTTETQQGMNALRQQVGTIGTQTIVSTDPKVVAEVRQVGVDTVKAVSESVERTGANRLKVEAAIVVALLGIGVILLFTQAPTNGSTSLVGKLVGATVFVAACAALLTMIL